MSWEDVKLHSKWVGKTWNYTRNERERRETTLETGGEDVKPHSKWVEKMYLGANLNLILRQKTLKNYRSTLAKQPRSKSHSFRVKKIENYTRLEWGRSKTTLVSGEEDRKLHSFRVRKIENYTRFEWKRPRSQVLDIELPSGIRVPVVGSTTTGTVNAALLASQQKSMRWKTTLETGGKDVKLHSKRDEKMWNYTRNGWRRCETTLETSGEDDFRELTVHGIPPTTPLSDVIIFFNKVIFSTRFECCFTSSSLETSVNLAHTW